MRPWLIASGDFTTLGGMDRANHGLAGYLARTGRSVHLVAHRVSPDLAALPGLTVHAVPRPLGAHMLGAPLLSRTARRRARELGHAACVLANGGNAALDGATWVHYLHAAHTPETVGSIRTAISARVGRQYYLSREGDAIQRASVVICNSERTASDVEEHYQVPRSRIRVIYYGVDAKTFAAATDCERRDARKSLGLANNGQRVAVFIGALGDRRKGFDILFEAWRGVSADPSWDVDLLVAGAGGERDAWIARTKRAGLDSRIRFLGFRADVETVFAAADLLVHPARYEAYGLGVHEAICRGVPSIVTARAGIAERYPRELGGLLIPDPPRAETLATALRAWRSTADCWPARVRGLSATFTSRSWDDMAAEIAGTVERR
jgi:glycosyltransferase involved in cell wall biosynthesis